MSVRLVSSLVFIALVFVCPRLGAAQQYNFPDRRALIANTCPFIELTSFTYENRYADRGMRFEQSLKWKNIGTQAVTAFEIVILKYDPFNRRLIGTRMMVTGMSSIDWKPLPPGATSGDGTIGYGSEEVFTGVAYVRSVRLQDGTIWHIDDSKLLPALRSVAPDIKDFGSTAPDPEPKARP